MERVEMVAGSTFVLRTRQVGPERWCCDVYSREVQEQTDRFLLEDFGDSELEAIAMALSEVHH
jgi:hypothetical protein